MSPIPPSEMTAQDRPRRICLFGGTFDPIHLGHIHIAEAAVESLNLDRVIFLPCRQSPHKSGKRTATGKDRLAMCKLATSDLSWAEVNDFDLCSPEPSYSWRTAEFMRKNFPEADIFWLMGTDQWQALPKWDRPDRLAELLEFIVFARGLAPVERPGFKMHAIAGEHPASATSIRKGLKHGDHKNWLDPDVMQYIQKHQLYRDS